jgi:hypothetical protein
LKCGPFIPAPCNSLLCDAASFLNICSISCVFWVSYSLLRSPSTAVVLDELYVPPGRGNEDFGFLPPWFQTRKKDVGRGGSDMVSTISFIRQTFNMIPLVLGSSPER